MPSMVSSNSPAASQSGITTGETGDRIIASSTRPDGTVRKEIRVRPGYRPPEDVEVYKNRTAESWKNRGKGGVPGAKFVDSPKLSKPSKTKAQKKESSTSATNIQESSEGGNGSTNGETTILENKIFEEPLDPKAEAEKEARKLSKKLRQARDLQQKREKGDALLPEQFQKVIQMNELIRQLDSLGFDQEGQKKP